MTRKAGQIISHGQSTGSSAPILGAIHSRERANTADHPPSISVGPTVPQFETAAARKWPSLLRRSDECQPIDQVTRHLSTALESISIRLDLEKYESGGHPRARAFGK